MNTRKRLLGGSEYFCKTKSSSTVVGRGEGVDYEYEGSVTGVCWAFKKLQRKKYLTISSSWCYGIIITAEWTGRYCTSQKAWSKRVSGSRVTVVYYNIIVVVSYSRTRVCNVCVCVYVCVCVCVCVCCVCARTTRVRLG